MQGWRRAPRIPSGCKGPWQAEEEEGDTHQMHVGRGRAGHVCGAWGRHRAVPRCCRQPTAPVVLYFPLWSLALEGAAMLLPLPSGTRSGREAGSKELHWHPAAKHWLAPLKGCARKSGAHWCQRAPGGSRGRRHPQTFFPPPFRADLSHGSLHGSHRITESQNGRGWKGPLWVI